MVKKYEITRDCKTVDSVKVCRIKALKDINTMFNRVSKGDLGGYVEKENNLSQEGDAWVSGNAVVKDNALVGGNAWVSGNAVVKDNALVSGNALVGDEAIIMRNARVREKAVVSGNALVNGNALVECYTFLSDSVKLSSGRVCVSSNIVFNSQDKLDDYLKYAKKYEAWFEL
jgi:carbonic anhydrase/acetyltransferase-like protein (isoleucine patch superfamily)